MKKLLSIVLALVMVLTFMVPAFAEGTTVVYYIGDAIDGEAVTGLTAGETYTPDRMPNAAAPEGKYFAGWKDASGNYVLENGMTVAEGENALYASYVDYPVEEKAYLSVEGLQKKGEYDPIVSAPMVATTVEGEEKFFPSYRSEVNGGYIQRAYVTEGEGAPYITYGSNATGTNMAVQMMYDENGVAISGKYNTTYSIIVKFSVPKSDGTAFAIVPGFGVNYNRVSNDVENYNIHTAVGNQSSAVSKRVSTRPTVDGTQLANGSWGYSFTSNGATEYFMTTDSAKTGGNISYIGEAGDTVHTAVYSISTSTAAANVAPYFTLLIKAPAGATNFLNTIDIKEVTIVDATAAKVQYIVNDEVESTVSGLTAGSAYVIDRVPTAAAPAGKYFAGWVDESGAAIVSNLKADGTVNKSHTLASGTNKFYAKYVDYATTFKPYFLNKATALAAGVSSGGALSNTIASVTNWSNVTYDTANGVYSAWTTVHYTQENIILLTDENGIAYQAEPNSTYKITVRAKNTAPDIAAINAANAAAGATKVYTEADLPKNQINFGLGLKVYPDLRSGNYASSVHSATSKEIDFTSEYEDYTFTITTGDLSGVNPQFVMRVTAKPTLQLLNANNENTGVAPVATYGKHQIDICDVTVEKIVGSVEYSVNGEAFGEGVDNLVIGSNYTIDRMPENTNTHYFAGWYFDEEFENYANSTFTVKGATTLYAKMLPYADKYHFSSSGAAGTKTIANWKYWEREGNWNDAYRTFGGYYKMIDGNYYDILSLGGYGVYKAYNRDNGCTTTQGDTWNQPTIYTFLDENGDAIAPQPGATYRVTVTLKSSHVSATESEIAAQIGWPYAKLGGRSTDTTFDANGGFTNWNSAYDVSCGSLENTSGAYNSGYKKYLWDGEWHTVTMEVTAPSLETFKEKGLAQDFGLRLSSPANNKIIYSDIIIEKIVSNVNYYVGDEIVKTINGAANPNEFNCDYVPAAAEGKFFAGWKDASGNFVTKAVSLEIGDNNFYAVFGDIVDNGESVKAYIAKGRMNYANFDSNGENFQATLPGGNFWWTAGTTEFEGKTYDSITYTSSNNVKLSLVDENNIPIVFQPGKAYNVSVKFKTSNGAAVGAMTLAGGFNASNEVGLRNSIGDTYQQGGKQAINAYYSSQDHDNLLTVSTSSGGWNSWQWNVTTGGHASYNLPACDDWQTINFSANMAADYTGYYPVFMFNFSLATGATILFDEIIVSESTLANKLETGTVNGKEVGYVKIADNVEDKATYRITLRGASNGHQAWVNGFFATADADDFVSNRSIISDTAHSFTFGYAWEQNTTVYITVNKANGQGDALYAYFNDPAKVTVFTIIDIEKVDGVANGGVSMLADMPEDAKQALRFYFDYKTTTGSDIVIGGKKVQIASRGFLIADASKVGDAVVTRATASSLGAVDSNTTDFTKCWDVTDTGTGVETLTFSTYIKGFKAEDGSYNYTQKIYVKGYIVLSDGSIIYSDETAVTVKDVADGLGNF